MSLRGRFIIDKAKKWLSSGTSMNLSLPCPPYANAVYWKKVYEKLGPEDCYEWSDYSFDDFYPTYSYRLISLKDQFNILAKSHKHLATKESVLYNATSHKPKLKVLCDNNKDDEDKTITTTFGETIGFEQDVDVSIHKNTQKEEDLTPTDSVLIVGCGNSRFGERMIESNWRNSVESSNTASRKPNHKLLYQVDICQKVLNDMEERCHEYVQKGNMEFILDDATQGLNAFNPNTIDATIDKGLMDALFCADAHDSVGSIMSSVHRILKPGGVFVALSFSRPQFILEDMLLSSKASMWENIEVRELDNILLYRFKKSSKKNDARKKTLNIVSSRRKL